MPDNNEGAVCGTCHGSGDEEVAFSDSLDRGPSFVPCRECGGTGGIPAPVVPSDERCGFKYESGYLCNRTQANHWDRKHDWVKGEPDWQLRGPLNAAPPTPSRLVVPSDALYARFHHTEIGGEKYIEDTAPPTPSQDAEGDGLKAAWFAVVDALSQREWVTHDKVPAADAKVAAAKEAVESAIRAPYEELVKAARDARSALVLLTSELSGQMGYIEGLQQRPHGQPQRTINYAHDVHAFLTATLTRIEESQGVRDD